MKKGIWLLCLIVVLILSTGCEQEAIPKPTEKVLTNDFFIDYVQGEYLVEDKDEFLGYLLLNRDSYEFIQNEDLIISDGSKMRLSFLEYTTGEIEYSYYGEMNSDIKISEIDNNDTILHISFINPSNSGMMNIFGIRFNKDHNSLYFHSSFSELQTWGIGKDLLP